MFKCLGMHIYNLNNLVTLKLEKIVIHFQLSEDVIPRKEN